MVVDAHFEGALRTPDPVAELRKVAQRLLEQGNAAEAVLGEFERARQELRAAGREADEDAVMDVMDFLAGWCSPHLRLADTERA